MNGWNWSGWVRYGAPGLLLGLGLAWGVEGRGPSAHAQSTSTPSTLPLPTPAIERSRGPVAGQEVSGGGTIAISTPGSGSAQLLFLIDTKSRALAVYRVDPSNPKGSLKLEAARQYQWDLKLAEYNNLPPEVAAIESTVKSLGQPTR